MHTKNEQDPTDMSCDGTTHDTKIRAHRAMAYGFKCNKNIQVAHYMWDLNKIHVGYMDLSYNF